MKRPIELLALALAACGTAPVMGDPVRPPGGDPCTEERDRSVNEAVSASASIDAGPIRWGAGSAAAARLVEVKLGYDALQKDFGQMAERLCRERERGRVSQAWYERRRECLDNAQIALRGVSLLAGSGAGGAADPDPTSVAMALEARLALLRDTLACGGEAGSAPASASATTPAPAPVGVTAWLTCERRGPNGAYTPVTDCQRTPLTEGDRARVTYRVDAPAHVYLTSRNGRGQFQMLWPAPGDDARVPAGTNVSFPPNGAFLVLDAVSGVTELLQVAAFTGPSPAFEELRGRDVPAGADPGVLAATVAVEPVLTRGWRLPTSNTSQPTASKGAVELRVIHR